VYLGSEYKELKNFYPQETMNFDMNYDYLNVEKVTLDFSQLEFMETAGIGLMIGADVEGITASDLVRKALENGLMLLTAKTSLRFLPPLTITYNEIDRGISILKNILEGK